MAEVECRVCELGVWVPEQGFEGMDEALGVCEGQKRGQVRFKAVQGRDFGIDVWLNGGAMSVGGCRQCCPIFLPVRGPWYIPFANSMASTRSANRCASSSSLSADIAVEYRVRLLVPQEGRLASFSPLRPLGASRPTNQHRDGCSY